MAAGGDPTLAVHPLTGKSLPYVGVMLEAALSDATKANASRIADPEAATLWEVIRVTTAHARGGRAEVSAGELSAALPAANDTINNYLRALGKASATGGARKRPRRQVEASVDPPAEPEVQGRATGSAKRVRNGSSGPTSGSQPRPAAARPVAAARPASAAREAAGPIEGRTSDDTVRRLRAQEVAYLFNRSNWDGDGDAKFAALLRRPDEDQTWAAEKVLSLTNRGKDVSGFLAHLPQLKAWIASALAGRVYLVIEALCKALVRLDAQSMFARGRSVCLELGKLMKTVRAELAYPPPPDASGVGEVPEVGERRSACRSAAKDLYMHMRAGMTESPSTNPSPTSADGTADASSPPSVLPDVQANDKEKGVSADAQDSMDETVLVHNAGSAIKSTVAPTPSPQMGSVFGPSLGVQPMVTEPAPSPKLALPTSPLQLSASKGLSVFAGADEPLTQADGSTGLGPVANGSADGPANGSVNGSVNDSTGVTATGTADGSAKDGGGAPAEAVVGGVVDAEPPTQPAPAPAAKPSPAPTAPNSPRVSPSTRSTGLLLPRRSEPSSGRLGQSLSPPRRTASPRALLSPRQPISHQALSSPRPQAQLSQSVGGDQSAAEAPVRPAPPPHYDGKRARDPLALQVIGGSVYDAITGDSEMHEYDKLREATRGILRDNSHPAPPQAQRRSICFGANKTWILQPPSPESSPERSPYRTVLEDDDDVDNGDAVSGGLAVKVRDNDATAERSHFVVRQTPRVAPDSPAVDALLAVTLQRVFDFLDANPDFPEHATSAELGNLVRDISGSIDLNQLQQVSV